MKRAEQIKQELENKQNELDLLEKKRNKKAKKKNKKDHKGKRHENYDNAANRVNRFFENEAVEGTDDDGSDDDDNFNYRRGSGKGKGAGKHGVSQRALMKEQYYEQGELTRKTKNYADKVREMEESLQMRYNNRQRAEGRGDADYDDEVDEMDELEDDYNYGNQEYQEYQQEYEAARRGVLPSTGDPKLWQVKVKKGMEKTATMALLNKSIDFAMKKKPLEILSITSSDNIENYIFVEAYRKNSVITAVQGLNFVLGKIEILSLDEMPKIYENYEQKGLPEQGCWVRIKNGLYEKDIGIVERIDREDKVVIKLIPRIDPSGMNTVRRSYGGGAGGFKKRMFVNRLPQKAFNPNLFRQCQRQLDNRFNKHFYHWQNQRFRKGFLYKEFSLKQLDWSSYQEQSEIQYCTQQVKPTLDERKQFLEIYNSFCKASSGDLAEEGANDSSDAEISFKEFLMSELSAELSVGDKVKVVQGEMQGATGMIQSFEGEQIIFKPTNIEDFDDNIGVNKMFVDKFFEQGDAIRIIDGKYSGETGIITEVQKELEDLKDEKDEKMKKFLVHPMIKLDKTKRELRINRNFIKLKTDIVKDSQKLLQMTSTGQFAGQSILNTNTTQNQYRVGDLVMFNGNKTYGFIIQVLDDYLKLVNDQGMLMRINLTEVDKKIETNMKVTARDMIGNVLSIDDVVKCSQMSIYRNKKGVIKNICKNCLFLCDPKDFVQQSGIFTEKAINVTILGNEFLQGEQDNKTVVLQNRIVRDKLVNKQVTITKGVFKGQRGIVVKINGDEAIIELSTRQKKVAISREFIKENDQEDDDASSYNVNDHRRMQQTGGQSQYGTKGGFGGGNSVYGGASMYGGQTAQYEAGKTPMAFNSVYAAQTPAADRTMNEMPNAQASQWGNDQKSTYGGGQTFTNKMGTDGFPTYTGFDNSNQYSQVQTNQATEFGRNHSQTQDILTQGAGWGADNANTEIKNEGIPGW